MEKNAFMRACREGGPVIGRALRELDRAYFAVLFREAQRGLRDPAAAQDLVQDTFIKVWLRCATFHGDSQLLPWIKSILRHGLLDLLRKSHREVALEDEHGTTREALSSIGDLSEQLPTPESETRRRELDQCFRSCWARFEQAAPAHALVMSWIVEDGLNHEQIAELLGRTPGATREFISQCRKRARIHLDAWHELAFGPVTNGR